MSTAEARPAARKPVTPFEQGRADAREAIARGDLPCQEALDRAAAIIAASPALKRAIARSRALQQAIACDEDAAG